MMLLLIGGAVLCAAAALLAAAAAHRRARSSRAAALLSPAYLNRLIAAHTQGAHSSVTAVTIPRIAHCGDGKASTTDRVVVRLQCAAGTADPRVPPQAVLKCILLPSVFRMGATPAVMRLAAKVATGLRLCHADRLLYACLNLYSYYFPHAPDVMYENEALFYQRVRPELAIEAPRVYGSCVDQSRKEFVVLMEDLSLRGARFPTALEELSLAHVRSILATLATLHAQYWESPRFGSDLAWLPTVSSGGMRFVFDTLGFGLMRDHLRSNAFERELLSPLGVGPEQLWAGVQEAERVLGRPPVTLCHGDTHVQNTYVLPDGAVGLLDWQLTLRASWARDVSYILATALAPAQRRAHERELLREYLDLITAKGIRSAPSLESAWELHRRAVAWGLVIGWLLCPPSNYGVRILSANLTRLVAACTDLGTFDCLAFDARHRS